MKLTAASRFGGAACIALALVVAAPRIPILLAGPDAHLSLMVDDASYYLEAARRAVETGLWPSMDGRNPTNGFHPLYMLVLIAFQHAVGTAPHTVLPLVMTFHLMLNGVAAWLLGRIALRSVAGAAGWFAAILLALNPGWLAHGTLGVENGLSSLLLLALVLRWDRRFGSDLATPEPRRTWMLDGLLLGLVVLARTDAVIWGFVFLAWGLWRCSRQGASRRFLPSILGSAAIAALVVVPWLVANAWWFGTVVQDSGAALAARYDQEYGSRFSASSLRVAMLHVGFWLYRMLWAGGFGPLTGWVLGRAIAPQPRPIVRASLTGWVVVGLCAISLLLRANDPTAIRNVPTAEIWLGLGTAAFAIGILSGRMAAVRWRPVFGMALTAATLTVFAYAFVLRGFQVWYSTGPCLAFVLLVMAKALAPALEGRRWLGVALVALMATQSVLVVRALGSRGGIEGMQQDLLALGRDLRERLAALTAEHPTTRFGSFDSGELSYRLHPVPITNLDGVMNHAASIALRQRRLGRYLVQDGITHVISTAKGIAKFQRVSPFEVVRDDAWSTRAGVEVWAVRSGWGDE